MSCRLAQNGVSHNLASVKSRLVLPFWHRLTWVVPDTGPLNGCVCMCVCVARSQFSVVTGPSNSLGRSLMVMFCGAS